MNNTGGPHYTGDTYGTRMGAGPVTHTYPFTFSITGGTSVLVDTIKAATDNPVQVKVSCQIVTVFNAGSLASNNVISVGTSSASANEWLAAANTTATTAGYYPAANAVYKQRLTADTPIYIKSVYTGSPATPTTGLAIVMVEEFQENTASIT
jgi:hypothetical protein